MFYYVIDYFSFIFRSLLRRKLFIDTIIDRFVYF